MTTRNPVKVLPACSHLLLMGLNGWLIWRTFVGWVGAVQVRWAIRRKERWGSGGGAVGGGTPNLVRSRSHSPLQIQWEGLKHQWKCRACSSSVRQRRWENAAGNRAAPGPEVRHNTELWSFPLVTLLLSFYMFVLFIKWSSFPSDWKVLAANKRNTVWKTCFIKTDESASSLHTITLICT